MRVLWLTDIHLNFLKSPEIDRFLDQVAAAAPDAVLLGGDVGEARSVVGLLERLDERLRVPLYFVLGNHDFYFGSIGAVRRQVQELARRRPRLTYLTAADATIRLAPGVGLLGHDGWADAREGDYEQSTVMMNDYRLIEELAHVSKRDRLELLHALGDEAADHVRRLLTGAVAEYPEVVLLTHVPPLRGACWYDGEISDDDWAPHFVCQAMGRAILDVLRERPDRRLTVLCGHTHGQGECRPLSNVTVLTGGAEYGRPAIQRVFEFPQGGVGPAAGTDAKRWSAGG